jgi:hypothetical protein
MDLRPALLPRTGDVETLTARVGRAFDIAEQDGAEAAAQWFSAETGIPMSPADLHGWAASTDAASVARELRRPPAHELKMLAATREELVEIARRWLPTSAAYDPEHESWWTAVFEANVPRPAATNVAFYPPDGVADEDVTPEWIVEYALAYRPIEL